MMTRRGLLRGIGALLAAPAIVRASALMPISVIGPIDPLEQLRLTGWKLYYGTIIENRLFFARIQSASDFTATFDDRPTETALAA